ncbi:hypothetical protein [Synechococcus sp. PCC 7336]|uniref:hypothetical protein n=1 Tax=Synechococcus sp. PCC 7336 TaxID=195250 RepID=UPI000571ADAC|nr:hypothetical protein [Synechococcus sp. PCC 7336]
MNPLLMRETGKGSMQIYLEQLMAAWVLVRRGSGAAGVDGVTPELFVGVAEDEEFMRRQAASIIEAKLHNSRVVLKRLYRKRKTEEATQR